MPQKLSSVFNLYFVFVDRAKQGTALSGTLGKSSTYHSVSIVVTADRTRLPMFVNFTGILFRWVKQRIFKGSLSDSRWQPVMQSNAHSRWPTTTTINVGFNELLFITFPNRTWDLIQRHRPPSKQYVRRANLDTKWTLVTSQYSFSTWSLSVVVCKFRSQIIIVRGTNKSNHIILW